MDSTFYLFLVRHGEAANHAVDGERPLTVRGTRGIQQMAQQAKERIADIPITNIFHSPLTRARQSAEILEEVLTGIPIREGDNLLPNSSPTVWGDQAYRMSESIILVGHLPYMEDIVKYLVGPMTAVEFDTATMVCLERKGEQAPFTLSWKI
ncbi:MAG: phosphohistidine phosphatase SixA [Bdellovibrionales bacterium]|nr:phosphohistidine phosphatase SixA [Bdellovibrionales bacterium]MBT3526180.1 phosphohistidine phosphatase SixA [Bdellovibrionales bacterium]MBT7669730.1 phosphohistidine phosphatase SixA [Bdellovibrionales bacterium]MBT7766439.1 phosphohistidine phosphatase SixA [Bdellovibrionales bacterium]